MSGAVERIEPRGAFSLARAASFGFGPRARAAPDSWDSMRLAFCCDDLGGHAGVVVREDGAGAIELEIDTDADPGPVRDQVARILSLDRDTAGWPEVGDRDPVIGRLQAQHEGLRPVLFNSPYEAAAWSIISTRFARPAAIELRDRIAAEFGRTYELAGETLHAFPTPQHLLEIERVDGLPERKLDRLKGIAEAARKGRLDAEHLRTLEPELALEQIQELDGLGRFYAGLVYVRASGIADYAPAPERRLAAAIRDRYDVGEGEEDEKFAELCELWRPFRTWAAVLLRYAGEG